MNNIVSDKAIGDYLRKLIEQSPYKNVRQFCKTYLEQTGKPGSVESEYKRIHAIINGKRGIQLTDLPAFSDLLSVTYEEILSAGEDKPSLDSCRMTNYQAARTRLQEDWENYLNHPNKLLIHTDEYERSALDYAIEAANYDFIRFLIDNKHLWFNISPAKNNYYLALPTEGHTISLTEEVFLPPNNKPVLSSIGNEFIMTEKLRTNLSALAAKYKDLKVLKALQARKPQFLELFTYITSPPQVMKESFNYHLIQAIADSDVAVLQYFSEEFSIKLNRPYNDKEATFTYPYLGRVIEIVLEVGNTSYISKLLDNATRHNQKTLECLEAFKAESEADPNIDHASAFYTSLQTDILHFYHELGSRKKLGLVTNLVKVNYESSDPALQKQITALNHSYDDILELKEYFEKYAAKEEP